VAASRDGLGSFYADVIAVDPPEPWEAASAAYRLELLAPVAKQLPFTDPGVLDAAAARLRELGDDAPAECSVLLHGDFYLGNVLVHEGPVSALTDFEFAGSGRPSWNSSRWSGPWTRRPGSACPGRRC
jgi:aminoglycoside phosphotransferase (APT) family kinase protein